MTRHQPSWDWIFASAARRDWPSYLLLTCLWGLYFWRVLTPNLADQVSLPPGDFTGQFLAFGAYQARRILAGELPLWNPYNYAGHPFLADSQAAVLYPVRLITIFASPLFGGWSYSALQYEVLLHYWLGSLMMFLFVRTMTRSRAAGFVSAVTFAYGGYLTGYPPLQTAVLEAAIWLPLILWGILKASNHADDELSQVWCLRWLAFSGLVLGVSLLAGHPQTSLYATYVIVAFAIYCGVRQKTRRQTVVVAVCLVAGFGYGLAAIQIIPGFEYANVTSRASLSFDQRANGFPYYDLITMLLPNIFTVWSPLYSGVVALILASVAHLCDARAFQFWLLIAIAGLVLSFGGATPIYHLASLTVPGLALFRGQERSAYIVALAVAVMAGLGFAGLQRRAPFSRMHFKFLGVFAIVAWGLAVEILVIRAIYPALNQIFQSQANDNLVDRLLRATTFLAILLSSMWVILKLRDLPLGRQWWSSATAGLLIIDIFSNTMGTNWEPVPAGQRKLLSELVEAAMEDRSLFRVDGRLGLGENYGTLVGLQDIRGTSPLKLSSLVDYEMLPEFRWHELLAVKYVFTDWTQLPVPSTIVSEAQVGELHLFLQRLNKPMPRAWVVQQVSVVDSQLQALGLLADPSFDLRKTALLEAPPPIEVGSKDPASYSLKFVQYRPEQLILDVNSDQNGILVLSELYYSGWVARVDGQVQEILKVNAGLRGLPVTAGAHRVEFSYEPVSVTIGGAVSVLAVMGMIGVGFWPDRHRGFRQDEHSRGIA